MKRFWDFAAVAETQHGFAVQLDGKPVRLPGGGSLAVEAGPLAEALAAEWQQAGGEKGGELTWDDVPMTRLVGTALERIAPDPEPTVAAIANYAGTDLLCYRAAEPDLALKQARLWQPWLDWAACELAAPLAVTEGLMPIRQPTASLLAIERAIAAQPPIILSALGVLVPGLSSAVLGLAVVNAALPIDEAHRLAILDELHQEEFWGLEWEAEQRRERVAADLAMAARMAALAR